MKMQTLIKRLKDDGIKVTPRKIRYYIQLGLLPQAKVIKNNQYDYSELFYKILRIVDMYQKAGKSLDEIKKMIYIEIYKKALPEDLQDYNNELEQKINCAFERAESKYMWGQLHKRFDIYSIEEIKKTNICNIDIFNLAIENGWLKEKPYYSYPEIFLVKCLEHYNIQRDPMGGLKTNYTEQSKLYINNLKDLAKAVAKATVSNTDSWTCTQLFKAFLFLEAMKESFNARHDYDCIWEWDDIYMGAFTFGKVPTKEDIDCIANQCDEKTREYFCRLYKSLSNTIPNEAREYLIETFK